MAIPFIDSEDGYKKVIDQIMEFERAKLTRLETNVSQNDLRKNSLAEITEQFTLVSNYSRELYGLNSVFRNTSASSSEPGSVEAIIEGNVNKNQNHEIKVQQLATAQSISSKAFKSSINLPKSEIKLKIANDEINIFFAGGSTSKLLETLNSNEFFAKAVRSRLVSTSAKEEVLSLTSTKTGYENRIQLISDSGKVLTRHLELFKRNSGKEVQLISASDAMGQLTLQEKKEVFVGNKILLQPGQEIELTIGHEINFNEVKYIAYRMNLPQKKVEESMQNAALSNTTSAASKNANPQKLQPTNFQSAQNSALAAPANIVNVQVPSSDELLAEPAELTEEEKKFILAKLTYFKIPKESKNTRNLAWQRKPTLLQKEILGKDINRGSVLLSDKWLDAQPPNSVYLEKILYTNAFKKPVTIELPRSLIKKTSRDRFRPVNEIATPQNAKFVYENISLQRSSNTISNLIPGITINLKKVSTQPVKISTSLNSTLIYERIVGFFTTFNRAIELINISIAPDEESLRAGELTETQRKKIGLFNGDNNFFRLKENIKNLVSKPYPFVSSEKNSASATTPLKENLVLLVQMGIKRLYSIQNPYDIDNDKVDIDLDKLKASIEAYGPQIAAFFGFDTDNNVLIDAGIAYEVETTIRNFFQRGGYFFLLEERLTAETRNYKKNIESENTRLDERESELKSDFGRVEAAMQEQESIKSYFNQFNE